MLPVPIRPLVICAFAMLNVSNASDNKTSLFMILFGLLFLVCYLMITLKLLFRDSLDEVGAALLGALEGLLVAPLLYLGMVATEEDIGHTPAAELGGAGVFGGCEEAVLE